MKAQSRSWGFEEADIGAKRHCTAVVMARGQAIQYKVRLCCERTQLHEARSPVDSCCEACVEVHVLDLAIAITDTTVAHVAHPRQALDAIGEVWPYSARALAWKKRRGGGERKVRKGKGKQGEG